MATSSQQKQELFKAIWATAEDLRNSVYGWNFKSYTLGIQSFRLIPENITNYINQMQSPYSTFGYASAQRAEKKKTIIKRL